MKKADPPVKFEELYPDYPIKKVNRWSYMPGAFGGLIALALMAAATVFTFFILSKVGNSLAAGKAIPRAPATEDEMMASLPADKLWEIAVNCISVKDGDCARKIFSHLMKVNPEFINSDLKRKKLMNEASAL